MFTFLFTVIYIRRSSVLRTINDATYAAESWNLNYQKRRFTYAVPLTKVETVDTNGMQPVKNRKHLVVYNPVQGRLNVHIRGLKMASCVADNCNVTIMRNQSRDQISADAVVYQGNKIPDITPERLGERQVFVFDNSEPPWYMHNKHSVEVLETDSTFINWTLTYKQDSDAWAPYGIIIPRSLSKEEYLQSLQKGETINTFDSKYLTTDTTNKDYGQIFDAKTKDVLWLVSHCYSTSKRETYVDMMRQHINVDIYGKCGGLRIRNNTTFDGQFKFYLAFENNMCKDYITEKFFSWYSKDIIVVVRGGADYSKFVPEGSYVNAADFASPGALADFLNKLGSDRERYIGYLKRKDQYQVITEQESVQNAFCTLCWRLNHLNEYRNPQTNMSTWWLNDCWRPTDIHT